MNICYITCFYDIGRDKWNNKFKRDFNTYIESFEIYLKLFSHEELNKYSKIKDISINYELIVYLDEIRLNTFFNKYNISNTNIKVIPINQHFMNKNIWAWKQLDRETAIMESDLFKSLLSNKLEIHPENIYPEYTLINHAKVDFIKYTIDNKLTNCNYICWIDFGYLAKKIYHPYKLLDPFKLNLEKINYTKVNNIININIKNPYINLINCPDYISGGFFFGRIDILSKYIELYHKTLKLYHSSWLCDDDQAIITYMELLYPDLFEFYYVNWNYAFIYFQ